MQPQSLIFVTVDCLRADHVGFLGYNRPTTPFLDCMAKESLVFENAIAAGSPTYYAMPAILASRHPLALGRDVLGIAPEENTIASVLQESEFRTAGFSAANPYLSSRFGYDRGFDVFVDHLHDSETMGQEPRHSIGFRSRANQLISNACHSVRFLGAAYDELYFQYCQRMGTHRTDSLDSQRRFPSADLIVDQALEWLKENSGKRFFLWLHLMDAHGPYFPKPQALAMLGVDKIDGPGAAYLNSCWNRGDLRRDKLKLKQNAVITLYDAGIRWVDEQIRRLAEALVELSVWDRCALAVTADHGEEFLDHGGRYHLPRKLTEELVHVPLLLRVPGVSIPSPMKSPFTLIDLAPTALDVVGVPYPADFRGRSIWGPLRKGKLPERPVVSECVFDCTNPFYSGDRMGPRILAVRLAQHKLVLDFASGSADLYDLDRDPAETKPLALGEAEQVRRNLLQHARKHLVESFQSRDFDRRTASQMREYRLELARSAEHFREN